MNLQADDLRLDLPATNKYLNVLGACLDAFIARIEGVDDARIAAYNIELAVNEIVANIVRHAYANTTDGRVTMVVRLIQEPRQLLIELADTGLAFDPTTAVEPDLDDVQIHGYGLFLARSLMDDVSYTRRQNSNEWCLIKYL
ncbi:ATP-binding protein [Candidatus Chloroploca sp. Khr17]|uniref:ATP-binding protein n=1 Tax=Candidatus Chloroploca sp. Khr17 TaxID=2496869 RepID=UPI0013ED16F0|nr:ATP-binding protein [Candidatus Chloroploca sp. Khr17]